jgi:hypothetical protein
MKTLGIVLFSLFAAWANAAHVVQNISWLELKNSGMLLSGEATASQLRIENNQSTSVTFPLFKLEKPAITKSVYALTADIRYEKVEGTGYLEMWSTFPDKSHYFSRTLAQTGPMQGLSGSSDWRPVIIPFFNREEGPSPALLVVNLVLPGKGNVIISNMKLQQYEKSENMLPQTQTGWWSDRTAGLVFGTVGGCIGLCGALIGLLTSLGKGRSFVMILLVAIPVLGAVFLIAGLLSVAQHQPYAVFYPLLLVGLLCTIIPLGLRRSVQKRFEELELRKMRSLDSIR